MEPISENDLIDESEALLVRLRTTTDGSQGAPKKAWFAVDENGWITLKCSWKDATVFCKTGPVGEIIFRVTSGTPQTYQNYYLAYNKSGCLGVYGDWRNAIYWEKTRARIPHSVRTVSTLRANGQPVALDYPAAPDHWYLYATQSGGPKRVRCDVTIVSQPKIHQSFSSTDFRLSAMVTQAIARASLEPTAFHLADKSTWFEVWRTKLGESFGVAILFTENYKESFKKGPLQQEAQAILKRCERDKKGEFRVYILDMDPNQLGEVRDALVDLRDNLKLLTPEPVSKWDAWKTWVHSNME